MTKRMSKKDMAFEIKFYEGILARQPDFIEALSALGDLYTYGGYFSEGLEIDLKLRRLKPDDPTVLYNLACSYSLMGRIDYALRTIKKAINCGYADFQHLEADEDLNNLRKDTRFKRYFQRVKNKKISRSTKEKFYEKK